jgi:hypothetical protein
MTAAHAPATLRNRDPILAVLREVLPATGRVLEIASGTGEHVRHFAAALPGLTFQPSDPDAAARASIAAWCAALPNVLPPLALDAAVPDWPIVPAEAIGCITMDSDDPASNDPVDHPKFDACLCINMVHISAWDATRGLFRGCARVLANEAPIVLYGPYLEEGVETASSNLAFDQSLKARNPAWGLRRLDAIDRVASNHGFERTRRYEMPANNLTLIYRKPAP